MSEGLPMAHRNGKDRCLDCWENGAPFDGPCGFCGYADPRWIPEFAIAEWNASRGSGPRSELARYAYGYSDRKPGWTYWLIVGVMTVVSICGFIGAYHAH